MRANTDNVVDLYFPPVRDEAPAGRLDHAHDAASGVDTGQQQRLRDAVHGRRRGALSALTQPLDSQAAPAPPTTEAELRSDLMSESPEYDTIDLPANTTIVITQPLEITHSVQIIGNNATLLFDQGDTAAWPATASGAIYVDAPLLQQHSIRSGRLHNQVQHELADPVEQSGGDYAGSV